MIRRSAQRRLEFTEPTLEFYIVRARRDVVQLIVTLTTDSTPPPDSETEFPVILPLTMTRASLVDAAAQWEKELSSFPIVGDLPPEYLE